MIEYHNDILGIEVKWLAGDKKLKKGKLMAYDKFDKLRRTGKLRQLRTSCRGRSALVDYDSMPLELKNQIQDKLGYDPYEVEKYHYFKKYIKEDIQARNFYLRYITEGGNYLKPNYQRDYYNNAVMLNAVIAYLDDVKSRRRSMGGRKIAVWENMSRLVNHFRGEMNHTLRKTPKSLQNQVRQFRKEGYASLISGKFGNQNTRKRNSSLDELIISLYVMEGTKLYADEVWKLYTRFITGDLDVYVKQGERAGELLNPDDYYDNGEPMIVSVATVRNILAQYRDLVDNKRNEWMYYNNLHRPAHQRHLPDYSLSKISLDDRDLPPLLNNGGHVKAYFVWDVGSGAILGVSFSVEKKQPLFIAAVQDAFRNAHAWGLAMPFEVEVEKHIVSSFKEELETMFPFVRWGMSAQEKRAEHFNRSFKYKYERHEFPTGRFYAKQETHRPNLRKEWDDEGMHTVQKRYTFKQIVALYHKLIYKYNHDKGKDGMSRIDKLKKNQHPDAKQLSLPVISRSFGHHQKTSLRRNQSVRVQYEDYWLPSPYVADKIDKRKDVDAYYLPDAEGKISEVYIYQNDIYICCCKQVVRYNEARAEWTDKDREAYQAQAKYVKQYDTKVKEGLGRMMNIGTLQVDAHTEVDYEQSIEELEHKPVSVDKVEKDKDNEDYEKRALNY